MLAEVELPVCPTCGQVGKIPLRTIVSGKLNMKCIGPEGHGHKAVKMEYRTFQEVAPTPTQPNSPEVRCTCEPCPHHWRDPNCSIHSRVYVVRCGECGFIGGADLGHCAKCGYDGIAPASEGWVAVPDLPAICKEAEAAALERVRERLESGEVITKVARELWPLWIAMKQEQKERALAQVRATIAAGFAALSPDVDGEEVKDEQKG